MHLIKFFEPRSYSRIHWLTCYVASICVREIMGAYVQGYGADRASVTASIKQSWVKVLFHKILIFFT